MNTLTNHSSNRNSIIEKHSETASSSMRKIVIALLLTVFGLAFEEQSFVFTSWKLKFAIVLFVIYYGIDMFQYIFSVWIESSYKTFFRKIVPVCFILKFIPALLGLIFILLELLSR